MAISCGALPTLKFLALDEYQQDSTKFKQKISNYLFLSKSAVKLKAFL